MADFIDDPLDGERGADLTSDEQQRMAIAIRLPSDELLALIAKVAEPME